MRIVLIAPFAFAPKATTAKRAFPLGAALAARGHAVSLVVPPYDRPEDAGQVYEQAGVHVVHVHSGPHSARNLLAVTGRVVRAVHAVSPEIVYVFKPVGYAALAGMRLAWAGGPPLVVDSDDWEGAGGWNEANAYPWLWRRVFAYQERWLLAHARVVTAASRALQTLVWSRGLAPGRVRYLPNCITPDSYAGWLAAAADPSQCASVRERHDLPATPVAGQPVVLLYTRFVEFPAEWVIQVLAALTRSAPGARMLVVGAGFRGEEGRLLDLARPAGLAERIVACGQVPEADLGPLLSLGDVALYPMRDTLINRAKCSAKLLDLMAMSRAIVTNRVGQQGEYLRHGESGWLAEVDDVDGLVEGVRALLADPGLAARLGRGAAQRVREQFSWERWAPVAEDALQTAAGPGAPHARPEAGQ